MSTVLFVWLINYEPCDCHGYLTVPLLLWLLTHILLLVVLDEVSQVHVVGDDSHLVRRLVAVVEDAAVCSPEQQHSRARLLHTAQKGGD